VVSAPVDGVELVPCEVFLVGGAYACVLVDGRLSASPQIFKNSSRYGTTPSKQPLGDSRRPQTSSGAGNEVEERMET